MFPSDKLVSEAVKLGEKIAAQSPLIVAMAKEAVNKSYEQTLHEGLHFERRIFHTTFSTVEIYSHFFTQNIFKHDRREGMTAFGEKRKPNWTSS